MKLNINRSLLPIKAHFFFFFAALGPLLPQMNVFGRQLGISPAVMGMVTAVLPLLWAAAKPLFGYVVDYWPTHRKLVFMLLITVMTGSYCCLWFLPMPEPPEIEPPITKTVYNLNETVYLRTADNTTTLDRYRCNWNCSDQEFHFYLPNATFVNTIFVDDVLTRESCARYGMDVGNGGSGISCMPKTDCSLLCFENDLEVNETLLFRGRRAISNLTNENRVVFDSNKEVISSKYVDSKATKMSHGKVELEKEDPSFYMTTTFWAFVILMCLGTVAFNVANCIGDAVCFDVLGPEKASKYGAQRAWGTAGYGITALLGGWLVDAVSRGASKDFAPAFILALAATAVDLYSCRALTLPSLSSPEDSGAALRQVLRMPRVLVFIAFAVVAGTFDSFIIYYMFWFLEELGEETGSMEKIKLIEGVVVAGQSFIGELLFFYFSGRIIKRFGYGTTMTVSLCCYGVRMALISLIQHPWHLVFIESIMQGPTYALCYSTIVGYAAQVAPEGYSATVQGIVAGMDDGVGFALGSLVGGVLYSWAGGRGSFRILASVAVVASIAHVVLFKLVMRNADKEKQTAQVTSQEEGQKMLPVDQDYTDAIYKDTVVPLSTSRHDGTPSTPCPLRAGVPQGSALCPLLYTAYTNDISKTKGVELVLFLDDTALSSRGAGVKQIVPRLQTAVNTLGN
ncbi:unnamed protein product [Chilo suppressalis]|uniref:Major facilitator superfamily (MFS) profile domain-containing protein n=1 Tax=Chilo suppressalis TaxID=168631 RepID=A0ABN8B409_CHISP|nr:unnamed protein product [Chilo suppressalis]